MKIFVTTKTRSKKKYVEAMDQTNYVVAIKEAPSEEKGNEIVITALSEYFKINKSQIEITAGHTGKRKVVELDLRLDEEDQ